GTGSPRGGDCGGEGMSVTAAEADHTATIDNLFDLAAAAVTAAETLYDKARRALRERVTEDGTVSAAVLEREQHMAHGLAWLATYAESLRQMAAYGLRMRDEGRLGDTERLLVQAAFGEYLAQIAGGIPMNQAEFVRPSDFGLGADDLAAFRTGAVDRLIARGNTPDARARLMALIEELDGAATVGDAGLDDTLDAVRGQMRRFADDRVVPHAHGWHLDNAYIPL